MNPQPSSSDAQNAITHSENTAKLSDFSKVLTVALELRKLGYSESYLSNIVRALKRISFVVDLDNPSMASLYIAKLKAMDSFKANLCDFYKHYCDFYKIPFIKPKYRRDHKIPNVPTEEKLNLIIGHASRKYAIIYNIIKECGLRPVEVGRLKLRDLDLEKGTISVLSAKHGEPRILKLKPNTHAMLNEYVKTKGFKLDDNIFPPSSVICNTFERLRTSLAKKFNDSELKKIRLYQVVFCDCRPWEEDYWKFMEWTNWYLLECPLVGIRNLNTARIRAKELKREYGKNVQVVIIGETLKKDFRTLDADNLYGISALRGANAKEEVPSWIFEREEIEKELSERFNKKQ